jgi:hypothetical protein
MKKLKLFRYILSLAIILIITLPIYFGCNNQENSDTNNLETKLVNEFPNRIQGIVKVDEWPFELYKIEIILNGECTDNEIKEIAYFIKDEIANEQYEKLNIGYYLPNMKIGHIYWATSHFSPNLEIKSNIADTIKNGFEMRRIFYEQQIDAFVERNNVSNLLGVWHDNSWLVFVYEKYGQYYLQEVKPNNSAKEKEYELIVVTVGNESLFKLKEFYDRKLNPITGEKFLNEYTDYYKILSNGDLGIFDEIGFISSYPKVDY